MMQLAIIYEVVGVEVKKFLLKNLQLNTRIRSSLVAPFPIENAKLRERQH
jgi:hypothetical protein